MVPVPGAARVTGPGVDCRISISSGMGDLPADLLAESTLPPGHPEAFHDAFARLHRCFEADVRRWKAGRPFSCDGSKYANVEDGWTGMAFINTCLQSNAQKGAWTPMPSL